MIRAVRLLNLRRARRQPLRVAIAVVALAAGVALPVSILVLTSSITTSLEDFGRGLAGPTPLRVVGATSRGGLDESVVATVENTPGVAAAVPLVQAVTLVEPPDAEPHTIVALGVDCRVERLLGPIGCDPAALASAPDTAGPLVSPRLGRELGLLGSIRTDLGRLPPGPAVEQLDGLNAGRVAVFPLPVAQRHFVRPGTLDVIYVEPAAGTDVGELRGRLEARLGDWTAVLDATEPPPEVGIVYQLFVPLFSILAIFGIGVGGILVYNTLTLSLEERRRQLAIAAALGAAPRLIWVGTIAEMVALGLLGGVLGTLGGLALGGPITGTMDGFIQDVLGVPIKVHAAPSTLIIGTLLGAVIGAVASVVPIRRALQMDVSAELSNRELRGEAAPRLRVRRVALFGGLAASGLVLCWLARRNGSLEPWQAAAAPIGFLLVVLGMQFVAGPLTPLVIRLLQRRAGRAGAVVRLGAANLVRDPGRTGIMATAVGAAVAVAFATASFNRSVHDGITANVANGPQDVVLASVLDFNNTVNIDAKLPPSVIEAMRQVPGVRAVQRSVTVVPGHHAGELMGVSGFDDPWLAADLIRGTKDRERLRRGEVIIGAGTARRNGVRPGDELQLATPKGFVDVPVQGVWRDGDFNGNTVTMDISQLERLYGPQPVEGVTVRPEPGVSVGELARRLRAADLDPALEVLTRAEIAERSFEAFEGFLAPFWAIQRALMLVAFVAVFSTLLLIGVQRRRELGLLAAVGMRPAELGRMVLAEAGTVGVVGIALATAGGVVTVVAFIMITAIIIGFQDPLRFDFGALLLYGPLTMGVVLLAAAGPAWRTSRVQVVEALQYE